MSKFFKMQVDKTGKLFEFEKISKSVHDATRGEVFLYEILEHLEMMNKDNHLLDNTWNAAVKECIRLCYESDKSIHPSDMAEKLREIIRKDT